MVCLAGMVCECVFCGCAPAVRTKVSGGGCGDDWAEVALLCDAKGEDGCECFPVAAVGVQRLHPPSTHYVMLADAGCHCCCSPLLLLLLPLRAAAVHVAFVAGPACHAG